MSVFKDGLYQGKTVFVTGGSSGINLRIAEAFGEAGARVAINGRNVEKLEAAVKGLKAKGIDATGHAADVREYKLLEEAIVKVAPIDVLVCGAAGNFPSPAVMLSSNGFKAVLEIDVLGTFNASRAAFDHLRKPGACILNISAPQAWIPYPMQAHVCAAKAGVDMLTRTLALEWGPTGVRVNSISPGPIAGTEGMDRMAPDEATRQKLIGMLPIPRMGTKDDVAKLALFLASDAASYITGSIFNVDGGISLLGGGVFAHVMNG